MRNQAEYNLLNQLNPWEHYLWAVCDVTGLTGIQCGTWWVKARQATRGRGCGALSPQPAISQPAARHGRPGKATRASPGPAGPRRCRRPRPGPARPPGGCWARRGAGLGKGRADGSPQGTQGLVFFAGVKPADIWCFTRLLKVWFCIVCGSSTTPPSPTQPSTSRGGEELRSSPAAQQCCAESSHSPPRWKWPQRLFPHCQCWLTSSSSSSSKLHPRKLHQQQKVTNAKSLFPLVAKYNATGS